jgi:hypothetical protein
MRPPIPFPGSFLRLLNNDKTQADYLRQIEGLMRRVAALESTVEGGFNAGFLLIPDGSLFLLPGGDRFLLPG